MCGIFGFTNFKMCELDDARMALNTLQHRGPDQWDDYYDENIYMGHRRLSILDLSERGKQPMISEDGGVVIAVNGEIYNFQDLKDDLRAKYPFQSTSDSEVLLYGFIEWGIDELLNKIDGMYAISIYDKKKNELYLARDIFGKKPIYFAQREDRIYYSSEIKAFFEFDDSFRTFSYEGIKDWIYHRGSHSKSTIFHDVSKLPPGRYLKIRDNKIEEIKYYDILDHISDTPRNSDLRELQSYLEAAIKKRLMSDVPVGLQLSGGVDSSLVGHYLKKNHAEQTHSFSIGFAEKEYERFSEEKYATFVAEKEKLIHHQHNVTKDDVVSNFEHVIWLFDGMLEYPNSIPIFLLSKYEKPFITVALTGEGADELFGGYTKFRNMGDLENESVMRHVPRFVIENLVGAFLRSRARALYLRKRYGGKTKDILENINCYITPETFEKIFGPNEKSLFDDIDYERIKKYPFYKQLLIMDHKTYLFSLLDRQDRSSMGASIESRLPFLDKNMIEWAINLDKDELFDNKENKKLLKKLSASIFGEKFTYRHKMGFPLPVQDWLDDEHGFNPYLNKIFDDDFLLNQKIDTKFLREYLASKSFDMKNLNYGDSERIWIKWFLMVIRTAQDVFNIRKII